MQRYWLWAPANNGTMCLLNKLLFKKPFRRATFFVPYVARAPRAERTKSSQRHWGGVLMSVWPCFLRKITHYILHRFGGEGLITGPFHVWTVHPIALFLRSVALKHLPRTSRRTTIPTPYYLPLLIDCWKSSLSSNNFKAQWLWTMTRNLKTLARIANYRSWYIMYEYIIERNQFSSSHFLRFNTGDTLNISQMDTNPGV